MKINCQLVLTTVFVFLLAGFTPDGMAQYSSSDAYTLLGYGSGAERNNITDLQQKLQSGEIELEYNSERGYLDNLLQVLDIDPDSQMLVFSATSLQNKLITPEKPRGLYFNSKTYIGYVQNSNIVEVITTDNKFGPVFYTFDNTRGTKKYFEYADQQCLVCHDSQGTVGDGVPMLMALSSVYNDRNIPIKNYSGVGNVGDQTPIEDRWGGWYVTGRHGVQPHLGNVLLEDAKDLENLDDYRVWNVENLQKAGLVDTSPYPKETSDIVALMVLEHQITIQNQITYIKFKAPVVPKRRGIEIPENVKSWADLPEPAQKALSRMMDKLVSQMVFVDAADLTSRISGSQAFVDGFLAERKQDPSGRSLRDLDLRNRLFKYPLSYLIYSDEFTSLPPYAKDYIYQQLARYLNGEELFEGHSQFTLEERKAALDILSATEPAFAPYKDHL
ncbi:MAG: hypothetical protein RQ899_11425 [Pseudomonadales bacterium]|nr:hypothetical protein [Pseudomonadales bacterium]